MRYFILIPIVLIIIGAPIWAFFGSRLFEKKTGNPISDQNQQLIIDFPEDELVTDSNIVPLAGSAKPESYLAVIGPQVSEIFMVAKDGKFSQDLKLENGFNQFTIIAFDQSGIESEVVRQIYLIKEESGSLISIANAQESSDSSNLDKFKQKLKESRSKNNLKVVAGTVKSVLKDSLTITKLQTSKTIKINDQTQIISYDTGNPFDFEKILANDFVVNVGILDSSGVYSSQNLLVSKNKEIEFPNKFVISNVSSIDENLISVSDQNLSKYKVDITNAKNLSGDKKLEIEDKIAIAGKLEDDVLTATHFVIFDNEKKPDNSSEDLSTSTQSAE